MFQSIKFKVTTRYKKVRSNSVKERMQGDGEKRHEGRKSAGKREKDEGQVGRETKEEKRIGGKKQILEVRKKVDRYKGRKEKQRREKCVEERKRGKAGTKGGKGRKGEWAERNKD
jgi:hypothetical protein